VHSPTVPREVGVCVACPAGVAFIVVIEVAMPLTQALNGGAVIFSERRSSISALRSIMARLPTVSVHPTVGVRTTIGVCDSAGDDSGDPPEW
jgi:hypothetical protein